MNDPILDAYGEYERTVAPAYELIRRARHRFLATLAGVADDPIPGGAAFTRWATPDEPNGAEFAVEAAIHSSEQGHPGAAVLPPAPVDADPETPGVRADRSQPAARRARSAVEPAPEPVASPSTPPKEPDAGGDKPELATCPTCEKQVSRRGLGVHRAKSHGYRAGDDAKAEPQSLGADVDRRNIDEECPKGCGRRFRWEPSLLRHAGSCDGKKAVA